MAQRYRMWLPKSKLLTRNMKGKHAEEHTSMRHIIPRLHRAVYQRTAPRYLRLFLT
ncbi:unnamed protein product [Brassica rapa]|uniref:Uncharacterized protein n=1 Tax=Brassica campestris TaxID=3711 RepID=A0A8D9MD38_BRACM|nr:unnamed protein product [Brassica rapa]